jgi:competence/damage-inducible protein CinA-like protein
MEAEIITIGTEILLGEIVDTNTRTLARALRDIGLDIYRTSTIGDNVGRIAQSIQESIGRASAVITTGGLGPTIDDATREGVAMAFDVDTVFIPELWDQIQDRFASFGRKPTENNRRQAHIPLGAIPIENPVGTAPAFIMESDQTCVISLPGVPAEMVFLLENDVIPYLRKRLDLRGIIKSRILRTAGLGESVIDKRIEDLEQLSNPTVGLSAHPGRVDIRITAKASNERDADEMIWGVEATLHQRLRENIYGTDEATLESVIASWLYEHKMKICTLEYGTAGALGASFAPHSEVFAAGQIINDSKDVDRSQGLLNELCEIHKADCGLALMLLKEESGHQLITHLRLGSKTKTRARNYAGKFVYAEARAVSLGLERLRRMMLAYSSNTSDNKS